MAALHRENCWKGDIIGVIDKFKLLRQVKMSAVRKSRALPRLLFIQKAKRVTVSADTKEEQVVLVKQTHQSNQDLPEYSSNIAAAPSCLLWQFGENGS